MYSTACVQVHRNETQMLLIYIHIYSKHTCINIHTITIATTYEPRVVLLGLLVLEPT